MSTLKKSISKAVSSIGFCIKIMRPRASIKLMKSMHKKNIIAIEIGTYKGENAKDILKNLDIKKLYCVDPYAEYDDYEHDGACNGISRAEKIAHNNLKMFGNKVLWIKDYSSAAADYFNNESVDFIYIDGNHEYSYVKEDIEKYYPKLKNGGIMAGHDIEGWPGVVKAVSEFCVNNNINFNIKLPDWIIIKK